VELQRPKLRHAHAALCDRLFGQSVTRTNALETLVISCWVRGLSDRDVEAMLVEVFGQDAGISRSTCSRICQRLRAEFDAWNRRDLTGVRIDYLYLDGSFFKMHPKAKAEPVLVAWGIDTCGKPVFLGLAPGAAESTDAWRALLADLTDRGLGAPLLVISDGGKGLCAAIECSLPSSLHQRCLVHVCRNLIAKVPAHAQDQVKRDYWAIFDDIEAEAYDGPRSTDPEALGQVAAPVLLLRGEQTLLGTFFADVGRYVAQHVVDAHVRELPGVGHFAPLLEPEPIAKELISFFESART
jgi:putative transposase